MRILALVIIVVLKAAFSWLIWSDATVKSTELNQLIAFEVLASIAMLALIYLLLVHPLLRKSKLADMAALENERRYYDIFNKSAIGIAHVGLDGTWVEVNQTLSQLLGYSPQEMRKFRFQDITFGDDLPEDLENVANLMAGKTQSYAMEKRYVCKDGSLIWINLTASLVRKDNGEPDFFVAVIEDISERKTSEQRIALLGRIVDLSLNEVYTFNAKTLKFITVNYGARQNLGYNAQELKDMTPLDLKKAYTRESFTALIEPLISGRKEQVIFNTFHQRKDGTRYPVEIHLQYLAKEMPPLFVAIVVDITQREELTENLSKTVEKLRAANAAKSKFLANMSHELRTPLNAIIGFSGVIGNEYLGKIDQEKYVEYAQDIENSGNYLLELINDILDLSKIEAGRYSLKCESLNIDSIIDASINLLKQRAAEKGVHVKSCQDGEQRRPWADPRAVKQMLINIMGNALKFTPTGGHITVTTSSDEEYSTISIMDTGIGISEEHLKKLMRPYVSLDNENNFDENSTGLGLSITKSLVSMHGGKMKMFSTEGKGTEVLIHLPTTNNEQATP